MRNPFIVLAIFVSLLIPNKNVYSEPFIKENITPVGISSFALGVPGFPLEDYKEVQKSVRFIATNQLWDFPEQQDPEQVFVTLKDFIDSGHQVQHEIHVLNGPGARKRKSNLINSFFGRATSTSTFKKALKKGDINVLTPLRQVFNDVVIFANRLEELGIIVDICPELEDNEDAKSFAVLLELLRQAGWQNPDGSLRYDRTIRNGSGTPYIRYERHPHSVGAINTRALRPGDYVNQDGQALTFRKNRRGKTPKGYFSPAQTQQMIAISQARSLTFFIWLEELQGFKAYTASNRNYYGSYYDRDYYLFNKAELINLLQNSY